MNNEKSNIGLALSGGGIRAAVFHLGVLKWMAEKNMLHSISRISTVSGASLAIGLIYSHNSLKWPTDRQYSNLVLPKIRKCILKNDIQKNALKKLAFSPWCWNKKVNLLSEVLSDCWGITGSLSNLEDTPKWDINCTTIETGKRFRFSQEKMGDYLLGYVKNPSFYISDAVAASAGFPILIGPYSFEPNKYKWEKSEFSDDTWVPPSDKYVHLWDGGVYDNLGMESIYKPNNAGELKEDVDFVIISNASDSIRYEKRKNDLSGKNLKRLLDISMDQNRALRTRSVIDYMKRTKNGIYLNIGNSPWDIISKSGADIKLTKNCLSDVDAKYVREYPTTLFSPSVSDFDLILRHGYEVAMYTYACYQ